MTQQQLDRLVAHATGEDLGEIRHRGFSIADLSRPLYDPEPDNVSPQQIDWDEADRRRNVAFIDQPSYSRFS